MKNKHYIKAKNKIRSLFSKLFGFEANVDIADEVALLARRNYVIRNIVTVSNTFYTILFLVLSIIDPKTTTNWIFMIVSTFLTFAISYMLGKLAIDKEDMTKQKVAMYVSALYIFLSSVLVYAKTLTAQGVEMETSGYILILYSLVVISLYQDSKLLTNSFLILLLSLTTIHLTMTHNIGEYSTVQEFFQGFFASEKFADILVRTIIFIVFFFVIYIIVSIGHYMQDERRKELIRRRQIQDDFSTIVGDLFTVVFSASNNLMDNKHISQVSVMAAHIANDSGLNNDDKKGLQKYSLIHLEYDKIKSIMENDIDLDKDEKGYENLKNKTELGAQIARRMQLGQKCEDIARAYVEGTITKEFIDEMNKIQPEIISQVILLADLYITLRDATSYKRPLPHKTVVQIFQGELSYFFDYNLKERFLRFNSDFDQIYNNF